MKYPRTTYWPWSPSVAEGDKLHSDPAYFVGKDLVITEKIDGGNTMLHKGQVYARSVSEPSSAKWMAMVKKHHAWKVQETDVYLYGEDIYGVHSIEYGAVREEDTFFAFAMVRNQFGAWWFASWEAVKDYAYDKRICTVPELFNGKVSSVDELARIVEKLMAEGSSLGGEREGVVIRTACEFPFTSLNRNVCKSVRANHVQTDEHWTRNWKPCKVKRATAPAW